MLTICAEVGINHNGDMDLCHTLIREAAINNADIVKFQLYSPEILFKDEPHLIPEAKKCEISHDNYLRILDWCYEEHIEPMFSVFDETRLEWTERSDIQKYKLATRSVVKTPDFCQTVINLKKTVFMSGHYSLFKKTCVKPLYCIPKYPAEYKDYKKFNPKYYGISDHTIGIENCLTAIANGAKFVEKHFTLSKSLEGSDHKCSMTPDELYDLTKYGKLINKIVTTQDE